MTRMADDDTVHAAFLQALHGLGLIGIETIAPETLLCDVVGLDSFALIYAVALLEEAFHVEADADALGTLRTAGDVVCAIVAAKRVPTAAAEAGS